MSEIGISHPRIDALDKVLGKADYAGDIELPDMLYMKILFAERPHAIGSCSIYWGSGCSCYC